MAYESLIEDTEIIQGDSSEITMFGTQTGDDLSTGWTAAYTISTALGEAPVVQRALPLNDGTEGEVANTYFVHQILPSESAQLTVGEKYWVAIEISNPSINYNGEVAQYKLKVKPQGVVQA